MMTDPMKSAYPVKRQTAVLAAILLIAISTLNAQPAMAATSPVIHFSSAQPNSPGSDLGSKTSLDNEWVQVKNSSKTTTYTLTGWTIRDKARHVYTFKTFKLKPGATVTLHTGKGTNTSTNLYWGKSWYVWNNSGDTAYLRNAKGTSQDSCTWKKTNNSVKVGCK